MRTTKIAGFLAVAALSGAAFAATGDTSNAELQAQIDRLQKSLEQVQGENKLNRQELVELKAQNNDKWLTEERAAQIRGVVQDVIADADSRSSLQAAGATGGYDKGFFLASPDGNFKLVVGGQLQARYALSRLSSASLNGFNPAAGVQRTARGFELRRVKLDFLGNVVDPSWTYRVTVIYNSYGATAGAAGTASPTAGSGANVATSSIEDAWISKDFGGGIALKLGQFKSPFNREELVSSKYQQCIERSLVNQLFTMKFTQGLALTAKGDNLMGVISFNDGGNDANTSAVIGNTNTAANAGYSQYALTGRVQWLAFGNWKQFDILTSPRGDAQGLMFGGGFNWQRGGVGDGTAPVSADGDVALFTYTADAQWMLGGANIFASFFGNLASSAAAGTPATTVGSPVHTYGATLQGGYFISDEVELYGRFEWYDTLGNGRNNMRYVAAGPVSNPFSSQHNTLYTVGLNWYIAGKMIKLSTDLGYAVNGVMFTNGFYNQSIAGADYRQDSAIGNGGQFVFRSQLQLLF
ncbi:MAG: OprO/OprP family phosphate-selective porin [Planctomycetes bacterium]|nr:OprO/OprP family phosphate-selective porin [Planctomycetota bacterium]